MRSTVTAVVFCLMSWSSSAVSQVISRLPPATGGDPTGEWSADSTGYRVYVPPDLSWLNLRFSGKLTGRFTAKPDSVYLANYIVDARATVNLGPIFGQQSFSLTDTANTTGRYSVRGTRMIVTGLDSAKSVDTLSYSVKTDTLLLMLPLTDPRVTAFGIRLTIVLPFSRIKASATGSADFDGSGRVDFDDFFLFAESFGRRRGGAGYSLKFDLNADGDINFDDFFVFADRFGGKG